MKTVAILCLIIASYLPCQAQLKTSPICPSIEVDLLEGSVNQLRTYSTIGEIQNRLPCTSLVQPETNGSTCGGVFFKEKGLYFYTERDYIEIGPNFK